MILKFGQFMNEEAGPPKVKVGDLVDVINNDFFDGESEELDCEVIGVKSPTAIGVQLSSDTSIAGDAEWKNGRWELVAAEDDERPKRKMTQDDWDEREEQDAFDREANESLGGGPMSAPDFAQGLFASMKKNMPADRWTFKYTADKDHPIELEVTNDFGEVATFYCARYKNSAGEEKFL